MNNEEELKDLTRIVDEAILGMIKTYLDKYAPAHLPEQTLEALIINELHLSSRYTIWIRQHFILKRQGEDNSPLKGYRYETLHIHFVPKLEAYMRITKGDEHCFLMNICSEDVYKKLETLGIVASYIPSQKDRSR